MARFVHSMFSHTCQTTVRVKIDKKILELNGKEIILMLWDMAGKQVRDASGYLLVTDAPAPKLSTSPAAFRSASCSSINSTSAPIWKSPNPIGRHAHQQLDPHRRNSRDPE